MIYLSLFNHFKGNPNACFRDMSDLFRLMMVFTFRYDLFYWYVMHSSILMETNDAMNKYNTASIKEYTPLDWSNSLIPP